MQTPLIGKMTYSDKLRGLFPEIASITQLKGKNVADVGAGSGRIAFMVAPLASTVFAVEPVTSLRTFMKEKAVEKAVKNLNDELNEIQRVLKPGGHAIHLLQAEETIENTLHETLTSSPLNYTCLERKDGNIIKLRYYTPIN